MTGPVGLMKIELIFYFIIEKAISKCTAGECEHEM